ncbi:MAG: TetR/AcrR family transcriptional regulator [Eubacteriaceae bacterium]
MKNGTVNIAQSEKILVTAFECISSKGYANVSMRDIANEAGVALSQLNYYYRNKEGLLTEVIKMMMDKYLLEIEKHLIKGTTAREKISFLISFFKKILANNPGLFRLLYDFCGMALWSSTFSTLLRELFSEIANLIGKYILSSSDAKEISSRYSVNSIARMIIGAMFGISMQTILDPKEENLDSLSAIELILE